MISLYSYFYHTIVLNLIQVYICPSSITSVISMDVSYIPIAKARGFTTHLIKVAEFFHVPTDYLLGLDNRHFVDVSDISLETAAHIQLLIDDLSLENKIEEKQKKEHPEF